MFRNYLLLKTRIFLEKKNSCFLSEEYPKKIKGDLRRLNLVFMVVFLFRSG